MRSTNVPPCWRANSQLKSEVRALPTCNSPVGDGAKRTLGALMARRSLVVDDGDRSGRAALHRHLELLAQVLRRVLVEDVEVPVVSHLKDLRQKTHADGVAGARVEVHDHLDG